MNRVRVTALAVAGLLLLVVTSCGGSNGIQLPSGSITRTPSASLTAPTLPTRTSERPTPSKTDSESSSSSDSESSSSSSSESSSESSSSSSKTSSSSSTEESTTSSTSTTSTTSTSPTTSASPTTTSATSTGEDSGVPTWLWWVLAAAAVALAVAVPLLVRRSRRRAWAEELTAAEKEVAWFARVLLPQLRQTGSAQALAGGWAVAAGRVAAAEDRLTALEATAPDETQQARARTLRDAVRVARGRVQQLTLPGAPEPLAAGLDQVTAGLERALQPPTQPPGGPPPSQPPQPSTQPPSGPPTQPMPPAAG